MTVLLPSLSRRSRFLFDWDCSYCLASPEQSLDARSGQVATFTRASIKTALDANSALRTVAHSLPAFEWSTDPVSGLSVPGLRLEGARTNYVFPSDTLTAGGGWVVDLGITATAGWTTGAGRSFTLFQMTAGKQVYKSVTIVSSGTHTASALVAGTGSTVSMVFGFYDATSGVYRGTCTIAINSAGVVSTTNGIGVATATALGSSTAAGFPIYRVALTAPSCVSGHAHTMYAVSSSGVGSSDMTMSGVSVELGAFATTLIPTVSGAVTRSADALTFALNMLPRALTLYVKMVDYSSPDGAAATVAAISQPGNAWTAQIYREPTSGYVGARYGATTAGAQVSGIPAVGSRVESRLAVASNGSPTLGVSINGAAESTATDASTRLPDSAFGDSTLYLGLESVTAGSASSAFQQVRIAAGVQTLAFMSQG